MANEQVSVFTELAEGPALADLFGVVDVSDTTDAASGTTKRNKAQYALGSQVNAQTGTTYTYLTTDFRKLVTHTNASAIAGTLPQAGASFPAGWFMFVQNRGAGALTITPTTSTIDGAATLVLNQNESALVVSDGTNYAALKFIADAGAPAAHASEHENGGSDEIDVTGLSGLLADPQTPLPPEIIDETGAPVTLDGSHNGNVVLVDNDVTVPSGLGSGFSVMLIQTGASSVEILESGTTVNNRQGHTHIADQFGVVTLFAYAANTFVLGGDTAT